MDPSDHPDYPRLPPPPTSTTSAPLPLPPPSSLHPPYPSIHSDRLYPRPPSLSHLPRSIPALIPAQPSRAAPSRPIAKPKKLHREVEQKRRMRMAEQIVELRKWVSNPNGGKTDKVSVLQDAVSYVKDSARKIHLLNEMLQRSRAECAHLRHLLSNAAPVGSFPSANPILSDPCNPSNIPFSSNTLKPSSDSNPQAHSTTTLRDVPVQLRHQASLPPSLHPTASGPKANDGIKIEKPNSSERREASKFERCSGGKQF